ncbi:uncharacterized protein LOC130630333 isoform X1 [Hydractinia symbiolongicarpus]|uniref:uncharacterized protein LOC130630333 isoform X1 n=1 Tax=Hydractinia symbiolongicarpus TaxID=13093 RepID=UPI00254A2846|nr:uncharacterized protein LOC130630333 isoform X1 [Hydractinia symbiolongicarpus]
MASKYGYFDEKIDRLRMLAYITERRLTALGKQQCRRFSFELLPNRYDVITKIFDDPNQYHPVLRVMCLFLFRYSPNQADPLNKINKVLEKCDFKSEVIAEEDLYWPKEIVSNDDDAEKEKSFNSDRAVRKRVYWEISTKLARQCRYLAHFLLQFTDVENIYIDAPNDVTKRILGVFNCWEKRTVEEFKTWENLNGVLKMLESPVQLGEIKDLDGKIICRSVYQNTASSIIVNLQMEDDINNIKVEMQEQGEDSFIAMEENREYKERKFGNNFYFIFNEKIIKNQLMFKILDSNGKKYSLSIPNIRAALSEHQSSLNALTVVVKSHFSVEVCEAIEDYIDELVLPREIWYNCGGGLKSKVSYQEWLKVSKSYTKDYYGHPTENTIRNVLIFPPYYVMRDKFSKLLHWSKVFLKGAAALGGGVGAVLWHYDAISHLKFMQLSDLKGLISDHSIDYRKRILLICPSPLMIFNIRYTDEKDVSSINEEIRNGDEDIKHLAVILNNSVVKSPTTFANVVAAPNFIKQTDHLSCAHCHIMDVLNLTDEEASVRYLNDLVTKISKSSVEDHRSTSQDSFMMILSSITAFMATRQAFSHGNSKSTVPSLNHGGKEQVKSMFVLTPDQLKVIHSEETKKIVLGNFGSGKTLVGVYQLQALLELATKETVIYYISWSDTSPLTTDVKRFLFSILQLEVSCEDDIAEYFHVGKVSVYVKRIDELSQMFGLLYIPSLSYLLDLLLEKHYDVIVHLIIDEFDGESLDMQEAVAIRERLESDQMTRSCILLLPHSLEKRRTFVNYGEKQQHQKYNYKITGMKVFELKKCMRITRNICEILKVFQEEACQKISIIKHQELPAINSKETTEKNVPGAMKKKSVGRPSIPQPPSTVTETQEPETKPTEKEILYERTMEIDYIASKIDTSHFSGNIKTETSYVYRNFKIIGHNIDGQLPLSINIKFSSKEYHEGVAVLSLALKAYCFKEDCVRLILVESEYHQSIIEKALRVLSINYLSCALHTNWKIVDNDNKIISVLPSHYTLITNHQGCRGLEAEEVIVCVDGNDELRHVVVENSSRATSRLVFICLDESTEDVEDNVEGTVQNTLHRLQMEQKIDSIKVETYLDEYTSTPYIEQIEGWNGKEWAADYSKSLSEHEARQSRNTCIRTVLKINTSDDGTLYEEYLEKIKLQKNLDGNKNMKLNLSMLRRYEPPVPVQDLKCVYINETSCKLTWTNEFCEYTVLMTEENDRTETLAVKIKQSSWTVTTVKENASYYFVVISETIVGKEESNIHYTHVDDEDDLETWEGLTAEKTAKVGKINSDKVKDGGNEVSEESEDEWTKGPFDENDLVNEGKVEARGDETESSDDDMGFELFD